MKKILLSAFALASMSFSYAQEKPVEPVMPTPPVPTFTKMADDGNTIQYLYNKEAKGFFLGANDWTTRASYQIDKGYKFKVKKNADDLFVLNDSVETRNIGWSAVFAGKADDIWVDNLSGANVNKWNITIAEDDTTTYYITNAAAAEGKLGVVPSKKDTKLYLSTSEEAQIKWGFVNPDDYTKYLEDFAAYKPAYEEYTQKLAEYETALLEWKKSNYAPGDDITFLANAWTSPNGNVGGYSGIANASEIYSAAGSQPEGDVLVQNLTGLKVGTYEVSLVLAGSYTSGRGFECPTGDNLAVGFIGEKEVNLPIVERGWVGEADAVAYKDTVEVKNGNLSFGIKNLAPAGNWYVGSVKSLVYLSADTTVTAEPDPVVEPNAADTLASAAVATIASLDNILTEPTTIVFGNETTVELAEGTIISVSKGEEEIALASGEDINVEGNKITINFKAVPVVGENARARESEEATEVVTYSITINAADIKLNGINPTKNLSIALAKAEEPEPEPENNVAVLAHTAAVQGGKNEALSTLDVESHYYNNWGVDAWAAQAYIGFNVTLPEGKSITKAALTFTSKCGGSKNGRNVDVYAIDNAAEFDWNNLTLSAATGTKIGSATDNLAEELKTFDVTDYIKTISTTANTPVIFQLGGAAAGAWVYGKASAEFAPALNIEFGSAIEAAIADFANDIKAAEDKLATYIAGEGLFMYAETELAPLSNAITTANEAKTSADATEESIAAAKTALADAVAAFAPKANAPKEGKAYILTLTTANNSQLSVSADGIKVVEEGTPVYFVAQENGYAISNGTEYVNYEGSDKWTMVASTEAYGWTIAPVEGGYSITGMNGLLGTNSADTAAGSTCYGDKKTSNGNYIWTIAAYVEPLDSNLVKIEQKLDADEGMACNKEVDEDGTTIYTTGANVSVMYKMLNVDVADCDYILIKFAEPAPEGVGVAFWNYGNKYVTVPTGATEYKYVFADDDDCRVANGVIPEVTMLTLWNEGKVIKVAGVYKHKAQQPDAIESVEVENAASVKKMFVNGKLVIVKGDKTYNVAGALLK